MPDRYWWDLLWVSANGLAALCALALLVAVPHPVVADDGPPHAAAAKKKSERRQVHPEAAQPDLPIDQMVIDLLPGSQDVLTLRHGQVQIGRVQGLAGQTLILVTASGSHRSIERSSVAAIDFAVGRPRIPQGIELHSLLRAFTELAR